MATKISPSDFTSTIQDNVTLNGQQYGGTTNYISTSCTSADQRVVTVGLKASEGVQTWTNLFIYGTTNSAGQGIQADFQYIRVTNLDDTNYCLLQLVMAATNNVFQIKLDAGQSYVVQNTNMIALCAAAPESGYSSNSTLKTVRAAADTAAVDIEIVTVFKAS